MGYSYYCLLYSQIYQKRQFWFDCFLSFYRQALQIELRGISAVGDSPTMSTISPQFPRLGEEKQRKHFIDDTNKVPKAQNLEIWAQKPAEK